MKTKLKFTLLLIGTIMGILPLHVEMIFIEKQQEDINGVMFNIT